MEKKLSNIIQMIKEKKTRSITESSTTCYVNGILNAYGWNVFDPFEVTPQNKDTEKNIPDLTLKLFGNKKIFIEIKKLQKKLNNKDIKQLERYLEKNNYVDRGFLTNSRIWWYYTSSVDENDQIKIERIKTIDILTNNPSKVDEFFSKYLSKEMMIQEWYEHNMNNYKNSPYIDQKQHAVHNLHLIGDDRVIEPFKKMFKDKEEDQTIRSYALKGLIKLSNEKDSKLLLQEAFNDKNKIIKKIAEEQLKKIEKEQKIKINEYKLKLGIQ